MPTTVLSIILLTTISLLTLMMGGCSSGSDGCLLNANGPLQTDGVPVRRGVDTSLPRRQDIEVIGLQTSTVALETIRLRGVAGEEKILDSIDRILIEAQKPWPYGDVGSEFDVFRNGSGQFDLYCIRQSDTCATAILTDSGQRLYARVLAYLMTYDTQYAEEARSILLSFARSSGFAEINGETDISGNNQCALDISLLMPLLIESALLMDVYPGWSGSDKSLLQTWLATEVYPVTDTIARTRKNNWGNAGSFASWAIAHYLLDSTLSLQESTPVERELSPREAKAAHVQTQLDIVGNDWRGDSQCEEYGVQNHGGIPDELRRGSSGCNATFIAQKDLSYGYQQIASSTLIFHAQALERHGDNELFEERLPNGERLVLQTVLFVIDNAEGNSHDWRTGSIGALRVLNDYYFDPRICDQLDKSDFFTEGSYLPYTKLTYPDVCR